jgi:SAM-dependent methyltransferase
MTPFGSEQALVESAPLRRWIWRWLGELHYGVRMRGWYLARVVHDLDRVGAILEVGSSRGQMAFWLRRRFPTALIQSIDVDPALVAHCVRLVEKSGARQLQFDVADVTTYADSRHFDLIICFDVLEHIVDWQSAVRQMVRLLSPGGRLVIHTPHRGRFQSPQFGLRRFRRSAEGARSPEHVREGFEPRDFEWLKELGEDYQIAFTFGSLAMWLHTVFEWYRSRSWFWRVVFTPPLYALAIVDSQRNPSDGGGLLVRLVAKPPKSES